MTVRYLISGSILLLFAKARSLYLPRGRELAAACFSGFLTLGIGNGALVFFGGPDSQWYRRFDR